jgi:hypothetical protein
VLLRGTGGLVSSGDGNVRLHNLVFKVLLDKPVDWKVLFSARSIVYELIHSDTTFRVSFEGFKVWFVLDRVVVYVKPSVDFKAFRVGEALRLGLEWFYDFVARLEAFIGFSLYQGDGLVWSVNRKHLSLMKQAVAMSYGSRGERLRVSDGRGLWLITDRSKRVDELEFIRTSTNTSDTAVVDNFFNYLKSNPVFYTDVFKLFEAQAFNIAQLTLKVKELFDFINGRFGDGL